MGAELGTSETLRTATVWTLVTTRLDDDLNTDGQQAMQLIRN